MNEIHGQLDGIRAKAGSDTAKANATIIPALIRTSGVLRLLVDTHLSFFRINHAPLKMVLHFIGTTITPTMKKAGSDLKEYITKKTSKCLHPFCPPKEPFLLSSCRAKDFPRS